MEGSFVINEANHEGKTALHLASEFGHVKVVALLMQRGALLHRFVGIKGNAYLKLIHIYLFGLFLQYNKELKLFDVFYL